MSAVHRPLLAALLAAAAALVAVLIGAATSTVPPSGDPPLGTVLSDRDRAELAAVPVDRGAEPPPADPSVDLADPEAVARAYLAAAYSVEPGDAGRTQRRAAAYAAPGSAAAQVGVLVLDPPPVGSRRTTTVTGLRLVAADAAGDRRGYRADLGTATGPSGAPAAVALTTVHVVLARQPGGRWLVTAESADLPDGED